MKNLVKKTEFLLHSFVRSTHVQFLFIVLIFLLPCVIIIYTTAETPLFIMYWFHLNYGVPIISAFLAIFLLTVLKKKYSSVLILSRRALILFLSIILFLVGADFIVAYAVLLCVRLVDIRTKLWFVKNFAKDSSSLGWLLQKISVTETKLYLHAEAILPLSTKFFNNSRGSLVFFWFVILLKQCLYVQGYLSHISFLLLFFYCSLFNN